MGAGQRGLVGNLELEGLGSLILKSKFEKLLIQHGSLDTGNIMYEVRDPWTAEEWQQWEAERRALAQSLVGSEARAQVDEVVAARGLDPELAELLVTQALALAKGHMRVRAAGALDRRVDDDGEAAMPVDAEALEEIASVLLPLRAAKRKADEVKDNDDDEAAEARRQLEVQQQEAWQLVCSKTRKAKRREAVGPYALADGAAAPEDAADGAARAIAIP